MYYEFSQRMEEGEWLLKTDLIILNLTLREIPSFKL